MGNIERIVDDIPCIPLSDRTNQNGGKKQAFLFQTGRPHQIPARSNKNQQENADGESPGQMPVIRKKPQGKFIYDLGIQHAEFGGITPVLR